MAQGQLPHFEIAQASVGLAVQVTCEYVKHKNVSRFEVLDFFDAIEKKIREKFEGGFQRHMLSGDGGQLVPLPVKH